MTLDGKTWLSQISYRPFGDVTGWAWGNDLVHQRQYDTDGRMTAYSMVNGNHRLNYDPVNNVTGIFEDNVNTNYVYDANNRLIKEVGADLKLDWGYDLYGNRISETKDGIKQDYNIEGVSNRLGNIDKGILWQYDSVGNLLSDDNYRYSYNVQNRLADVNNGEIASYRYNALGQRVVKLVSGETTSQVANPDLNHDSVITEDDLHVLHDLIKAGESPSYADFNGDGIVDNHDAACIATKIGDDKSNGGSSDKVNVKEKSQGVHACLTSIDIPPGTFFAYDETGKLIGEYNGIGEIKQEIVWFNGEAVALHLDGKYFMINNDHLGSPRNITNYENTVVWHWKSDAFGNGVADEDPDGDGTLVTYNLRFPGQYYDAETGKHYNYFRDYDPTTGRYLQSDPVGLGGGVNTYTYVGNNPVHWFDPLGLSPLSEYNPGDWANCTPVNLGIGTQQIEYSYIKELDRTWFGITYNNISIGPNIGTGGKKSVGINADYYDLYLTEKGMIEGIYYVPYKEMMFFCEEDGSCGKDPIKWETGPHRFSDGEAWRVDGDPVDTWYDVERELLGTFPFPLPWKIPL